MHKTQSITVLLVIFLGFGLPAVAQKRGLVTSKPCPYSCRSQGIKKKYCRDWKEGNICYVEDLRKAPSRPPAPPPSKTPKRPKSAPSVDECKRGSRFGFASPLIDIYRIKKSGNYFKDYYRVQGTIEGVCLVEAGYYEDGRLREKIPVQTKREFGRYEFEVRIRANEYPEIRAYNINGDRDIYPIRTDRDGRSGGGSRIRREPAPYRDYDRDRRDYGRDRYDQRRDDSYRQPPADNRNSGFLEDLLFGD